MRSFRTLTLVLIIAAIQACDESIITPDGELWRITFLGPLTGTTVFVMRNDSSFSIAANLADSTATHLYTVSGKRGFQLSYPFYRNGSEVGVFGGYFMTDGGSGVYTCGSDGGYWIVAKQ